MKRIGIDLDNVLMDISFIFKLAFQYFGEEFYYTKYWDFDDYPEYIKNKIFEMFKEEYIMVDLIPFIHPVKDIQKVFKHLKDNNYDIHIVTNRDYPQTYRLEELLYINFIEIDNIHVCGIGNSKVDIIKKNNIDIMIDDSPVVIKDCLDNDIPVIMVSNETTLYNHYLADGNIPVINNILCVNHPLT